MPHDASRAELAKMFLEARETPVTKIGPVTWEASSGTRLALWMRTHVLLVYTHSGCSHAGPSCFWPMESSAVNIDSVWHCPGCTVALAALTGQCSKKLIPFSTDFGDGALTCQGARAICSKSKRASAHDLMVGSPSLLIHCLPAHHRDTSMTRLKLQPRPRRIDPKLLPLNNPPLDSGILHGKV